MPGDFEQNDFPEGEIPSESDEPSHQTPRRLSTRILILLRRIHLYTGLFLLPWVLLYGITGAMFNHQELFPVPTFQSVDPAVVTDSGFGDFPAPEELARQVVETLQEAADESTITLREDHGAEFTNDLVFEVHNGGDRQVVHLDPISQASKIAVHPPNDEAPERVLNDLHNITLDPDPHDLARSSANQILKESGFASSQSVKPLGWTKLNFLADVNGEPVRITYVLKDGHVDVEKYTGEDGMLPRHFFLRLHTSHGQSPHWNGRSIWSLFVDGMAIAMVTWALTGLVMWWQIKRTRVIGSVVIVVSIVTASVMYISMMDFYATTKL